VFVHRRRSVTDKLLVLGIIFQAHVRLEETIHQFPLLFLTAYARKSSQKQRATNDQFSHASKLPDSG
jgi:hypothetical protein